MNYTNTEILQNQAFVAQSNKQKYISKPLSLPVDKNKRTAVNPLECKEFREDATGFIRDVHKNAHRILNVFISERQKRLVNGDKDVYVSQESIAKAAGFKCRATANRWLKKLCAWGILGKISRPYATCVYFLNGIFLDEQFRYELRDLFPAFRKIEPQDLKRELAIRSFNGDGKSLPHGFFSPTVTLFNIEKRSIYFNPSLTERLPNACAREGWVRDHTNKKRDYSLDDLLHTGTSGDAGDIFSKKGREKGEGMKSFESLMGDLIGKCAPRELNKGSDVGSSGAYGSDMANQSYEIRYDQPPKTMAEAARRNRELLKRLGRV